MAPNQPYAGILDHLPANGPAVILIRHAPRTNVEQGEKLDAIPLTDEGRRLAHSFGQALGSRLACVHTSLYPRCFQTAQQLVNPLLATVEKNNGVGVFITHDLVILVTVAMALGLSVPRKDWPEYLEGAVIWRDREGVQVAYRDCAGLLTKYATLM